jgi:NitT/TauT family transport system substrate-binding protein
MTAETCLMYDLRKYNMNKRLFRIISTFILIAILLSACSGAGGSAVEEKTPLRVSWSLWPGYYPMAIAVENGLFEKHGVQVEPVFYPAYNNQPPDLASGMIDGSLMTLSDTMFDSISSAVKVVLVVDNSAGADQIVASSGITSPKELAGKRIGVSRATVSGVLLVRKMLENNGVSPADVTFVEIPPEGVPGAIPSLIDAGYTYDPFTSEALAKGSNVIFTSADAPGLTVDVLALRKEIVRDRPEDVKAFTAAWLEAVEYWKQNPVDGNIIIANYIAKTSGIEFKPEEVSFTGADLFDQNANLMTFIPGSTSISVYYTAQNALNFLADSGDVTYPVDINELLDPSFLK